MMIGKTKGINNLTHWYIYKRFLIWNRNNEVQSRDLPVSNQLPVLPNDLPLPLSLPSRFYSLPHLWYIMAEHMYHVTNAL